jgi:hypothetical protein
MAEMGHTTADLTFSVYAREMRRRDGEKDRLRALVQGAEWRGTGSSGLPAGIEAGERRPA